MQTRSGRQYISDIEMERQRINNEFYRWKLDINLAFYRRTSFYLDDIKDLPYYDYFSMGIAKEIVLEIAMSNML